MALTELRQVNMNKTRYPAWLGFILFFVSSQGRVS